jgi:excisionase family DNA binding protein
MDSTQLMSTRQVAERLRVSEASVRRWSDRGLLPVQRVGRRGERRFKPEHVDAFALGSRANQPLALAGVHRPQVMIGGQPVTTPTHLATFYDSDAGRLRLTGPFLADGLRLGHPCFLVARGEVLDGYLAWLSKQPGVDLDRAVASGQLVTANGPGATVEAALAFWEEKLWAGIETNAPVVRGVGEMALVRDQFESEQEMLDFEAAVNMVFKRFPSAAICQYDVRRFSGQAVFAALRAHPDILDVSLGLLLK